MATTTATLAESMSGSVDLVVDLIWQHAMNHLKSTKNEILLPLDIISLIGRENVDKIKDRLSALLSAPLVAFEDSVNQVYRIMPTPALENDVEASVAQIMPAISAEKDQDTTVVSESDKVPTQAKPQKIPRPPNAFILYRQHHHPAIKAAHPEYHNNDISVILGKNWKAESAETKAHFKALAEEIKRKHAEDHPDYQYAPRKPSEKKRRSTARRRLQSVALTLVDNFSPPVYQTDSPTPVSMSEPGYEIAITPANETNFVNEHDPTFDFSVPSAINQDFNNMLQSHNSNFVMGYDEGGYMSFRRRRVPPMTSITPPPLASFGPVNPTTQNQTQVSYDAMGNPVNWDDMDFEFDNYFLGIGG